MAQNTNKLNEIINKEIEFTWLHLPSYVEDLIDLQYICNAITKNSELIFNEVNAENFDFTIQNCFLMLSLFFYMEKMTFKDDNTLKLYKKIRSCKKKIMSIIMGQKETIIQSLRLNNLDEFDNLIRHINDKENIVFFIKKMPPESIYRKLEYLLSQKNTREISLEIISKNFYLNGKLFLRLSDMLGVLYGLKNHKLSDVELKHLKIIVKNFSDYILKTEIDNSNIYQFDYRKMDTFFLGIIKILKADKTMYAGVISKIKEMQNTFFRTIFSAPKEFIIPIDLENLICYIDKYRDSRNFTDLCDIIIGITNVNTNEGWITSISHTVKTKNNSNNTFEIFQDQEFKNYKTWFLPSRTETLLTFLRINSKLFEYFIINAHYALDFLYFHFEGIIDQMNLTDRENFKNVISGINLLFGNLRAVKFENKRYLKYSTLLIVVNLIELVLKVCLFDEKDNNSSFTLESILNNKKMLDLFDIDFINFLRFFLLEIYIVETNEKKGLNLRNKLMHGYFSLDYDDYLFASLIFLLTIFNTIFLKKEFKILNIVI